MFGLFDLPLKGAPEQSALDYSSRYQILQMTHGKGIASGYISRAYKTHPVFPCLIPEPVSTPDITVNGDPVSCADNTLYDLATNNYRYVVWHKPQAGDPDNEAGSWGQEQARAFINQFFGDQEPVYEDGLLAAYAVPPLEEIDLQPLVVTLADNWYGREESWRWARSPATIRLTAVQPVSATMELVPAMFYQPDGAPAGVSEGRLTVELEGGWSTTVATTVALTPGVPVTIPLFIPAGVHELTLRLEAGNFRPADQGGSDPRQLSFAIRSLDFEVEFD
jgi:hypothetical protein